MKKGGSLAEALGRLQCAAQPCLPRLFMITDETRLPDPLPAAARLPSGSGIILRHYHDPGRPALARALSSLARRRGLRLFIADGVDLARSVHATGIHLPEHRVHALVRGGQTAPRPNGGLVTAAAHSPAAIRLAARAGADAVIVSPVFATASHPGSRPIGTAQFRRWVRTASLPVIAMGGLDAEALSFLEGCRLHGVAALGALAGR